MTAAQTAPAGRGRKLARMVALNAVYLLISVLLASFPADDVIDVIGADNAYLLMFVLGMIGGFTTFTGIPYHVVLMSLAAGGLNPIGLGLCTALGVMLGDSTMFLIGARLKDSLPPRLQATIQPLSAYLARHPAMVTPALVCYGAISPFSNDFLVASLSVIGFGYWRTIIPLAIGNVFFNIGLAYLGIYAYDRIAGWF